MRKLLVLLVASTFLAGTVLADPASITTNVNLRSGPGTSFAAIGKVPQGAQVDLKECDASGAWCAISFGNNNGFVSGQYLSQAAAEAQSWPKTFTSDSGAALTLFQPQVIDWAGFTELDALIAAELKTSKDASPVYGVIGVTAKTVADDETGNRALVSGAPLTAASADAMASTLAAMLRRTRGGQSDGAKLTISFNGSRTYTYLDNQTKPTVAASSIDQCRCPTESEGVLRWGNQVSCGTACPDKSLSARYVEIDVTRPYTPLLPAMGLVGADGFRIHTLAVLQ